MYHCKHVSSHVLSLSLQAGQVVQAVQTKDGIMLVTQPATESNIKAASKAAANKMLVTAKPMAASTVVGEEPKTVEEPVADEPVAEAPTEDTEAVEEPVPEATAEPEEEKIEEPTKEVEKEVEEAPVDGAVEEAAIEEDVEKATEVVEQPDLVQQALAESVPEVCLLYFIVYR